MNYPMKLMISGKSIAELRANALKFLEEIDEIKAPIVSQGEGSIFDDIPYVEKPVDKEDNFIPPKPYIQSLSSDDLDAKGFSWDARIHASSRAKTAKGTWRYRRGAEESEITQVEQELKQRAQPTVMVPPVPPSSVASPQIPTFHRPVISIPSLGVEVYHIPTEAASSTQAIPNQHSNGSPSSLASQQGVASPIAPSVQQNIFQQPQPTLATTADPTYPGPSAFPSPTIPSLVHSMETFKKNLIPTLGELVKQGKVTQEYLKVLENHFGVENLWKVNDQQLSQMFENFIDGGLIQRAQ